MAQSTDLVGPYDAFPTHEKVRMMVGVPESLHKELFSVVFTRRGVQDKILARLFHVFITELSKVENQTHLNACVTSADKEDLINTILNHIADPYATESTTPTAD